MTDRLATILMTSPKYGFGPGIQKWLLEAYNCSFGNSLPASEDTPLCYEFPDAKHIVPIFGYKESWDRILETWGEWEHFPDFGNLYYYNCGAGDWSGMDEPGTRGNIFMRQQNYGRAHQENQMVHALMPGLKTVVTHPFPQAFTCDRIQSDVWAWRLKYIVQAGYNFRGVWNIHPDKEVWAYLIDEDLRDPDFDFAGVGAKLRDLGISALLIYKATHPTLYDADEPDVRLRMTAKARGLFEGMVNA